jgi:hypothetical protein
MIRSNVSDALSDPSPAVTLSDSVPLKSCGGVPEKVRVASSKLSQLGSGSPLASVAD